MEAMIGKEIVFTGVKYRNADAVIDQTGTKVELIGTVLDAYTKISTSGMPNGSTSTSTDRTYIVKKHNDTRLIEVSFRDVIRLAEPRDFTDIVIEDSSSK